MIYAYTMLTAVFVSVLVLILETEPEVKQWAEDTNDLFFILETIVVLFFVFDYVARLLTCKKPLRFIIHPLNIVDIVSIIPYFLELPMQISGSAENDLSHIAIIRMIRYVRIYISF